MAQTKADEVMRKWLEVVPRLAPFETIARELCATFDQDPDEPLMGDERQLNWHYQASELLALRDRIFALRRAGFLGL